MTPSADERLQEELWRGAIPVEVHLASDEVATADPPPPVFALVPRAAYLPVWHDTPDGPGAAFASALPPGRGASPWFDHEGLPLRWNLPAGVLHDLTVARRRADEDRLPWRLTAHYRPNVHPDASSSAARVDDGLYRCEGEDAARAHFFNALKEATHVTRGSAAAVMAMTRAAREGLWRSVATGNRTDARKAMEELFEDADKTGTARRVPLRVYARLGGGAEMRGWNEVVSVSAPASVLADESAAESTADGAKTSRGTTLGDALERILGEGALVTRRATVHGVEVSPRTNLEMLHAAMRSPDQFLHVCVF